MTLLGEDASAVGDVIAGICASSAVIRIRKVIAARSAALTPPMAIPNQGFLASEG